MEKIIASLFTKKPSLLLCIIMDLVGMLSYFPAFWGEWNDLVWAPVSAYLFKQFFGGIGGMLGGALSFLEEIIPFTDIIPTFTLAWYIQNKHKNNITSKKSTLDIEDAEVIEIK